MIERDALLKALEDILANAYEQEYEAGYVVDRDAIDRARAIVRTVRTCKTAHG